MLAVHASEHYQKASARLQKAHTQTHEPMLEAPEEPALADRGHPVGHGRVLNNICRDYWIGTTGLASRCFLFNTCDRKGNERQARQLKIGLARCPTSPVVLCFIFYKQHERRIILPI